MRGLVFTLVLLIWAPVADAVSIERVTSPAGIEAWLVEDHMLPIVSMRFVFRGGAALDPPGKGGLAAMVAALLDEGAGPYDAAVFKTRIEDLAINLRFEAGRDEIGGSLRSLKSNLPEAADLLRAALSAPRFDPAAIVRIRARFVSTLSQQAQSPQALSKQVWMRKAFKDHPYGGNVEGTPEGVAAITRDDMIGFAARRLTRAGLAIGAVGDITADELRLGIERIFGDLPREGDGARIADTRPASDGGVSVTRRPVPQSVVTFGQTGPKRDDPQWYAARVVNEILGGGGFRGRLMRAIREERGLAYAVSSELVSLQHAGLILGNVATENSRIAQTIGLIRAEWRRMRDEGPNQAELDLAKAYLIGSFPLTLDSGPRIAVLLVDMQRERLGIDYLDRRASLFDAVTLDEARRVARGLLDPSGLSFAVVGDPDGLSPTPSDPATRF